MALKILGGFVRGQTLATPKGEATRPTSVMLRRRVFDFFQDLNQVNFIDLCAGSGAMGFEAWSRGAKRVYLNEIDRKAQKIIEENRENLLTGNRHLRAGEIFCGHLSAEKWIKQFRVQYELWDEDEKNETVIFLDPPYSSKNIYIDVIQILLEESWYLGQLWVESDAQKGLSCKALNDLGLVTGKIFEQGGSYLLVTNFPQV